MFDAAVAAADPMITIPAALPPKPDGRVVVIGAGKASARMAEAVESAWGPCDGLVLTRYGYARPCVGIEIVEAAHPVPDAAGVAATERLFELLDTVGPDDFVLCLISGGGSALLCAPAEGVTLAEKQAVNAALLASGAPIGSMNVVRQHLSRVKGGQLAARAYPATMLSLMISDVPGDDPALIASGPTVSRAGTVEDARRIVAQYGIALPASAEAVLDGAPLPLAPGDDRLSTVENRVISAPSQSLEAAARVAEAAGATVRLLGDDLEGEARDLAAGQAKAALEIQAGLAPGDAPVVLLSGGECTVTRRGDGVGGPNAEFVLAAARALGGQPGIHVLACDTDGVDGAAEVAGAIAGPETLDKARAVGADPDAALAINDAHRFFGTLGDQIVPGPTLTNVNDFRAFVISPL
nr:glycerate kinase [Poseidonocella sedimentorum]